MLSIWHSNRQHLRKRGRCVASKRTSTQLARLQWRLYRRDLTFGRGLAPILPVSTAGVSATVDPEMLLQQKLDGEEQKMLGFLRSWRVGDPLPGWLIDTRVKGVK